MLPTSEFQCPECGRLFDSSWTHALHRNKKCQSMNRCSICGTGKVFGDRRALATHQRENHFTCDLCERRFQNCDALARHYQNHKDIHLLKRCSTELERHLTVLPFRAGPWASIIEDSIDESQRTICYVCNRKFSDSTALNNHLRASHHTNGEPVPLIKGIKSTATGRFELISFCRKCNQDFLGESEINQHLQDQPKHRLTIVTDPTLYCVYCLTCGMKYNSRECHIRHFIRHVSGNLKQFKCFFCSSRFKRPSGLAQHLESGCKRLAFDRHQVTTAIQSLKMSSPISLRSPEEKLGPFDPNRPTITYRPNSSIHTHSIKHECNICSKTFQALHSLEAHLNSPVHDDNEFMCPQCVREFKLVSGLVQHLESGKCGLSSASDVERRFMKMTAQLTRALSL